MKRVALTLLSLLCLGTTMKAQTPSVPDSLVEMEAIEQMMDRSLPNFQYPGVDPAVFNEVRLNKYNFPPDSVPVYPEAVYKQRLKEIRSPIPMDHNQYVQAFINLYVKQRREQMHRMLGLQYVFFPIFEQELDRQGAPIELKYLPVVESALNPHAKSRAGAVGLWQFMHGTGKLYKLEINSYVDERRDPYKATAAAVRYLKDMYKSYGDWLLVIAAYNCGPGRVNRAIIKSGGKTNFWEIREYLPSETRGYVPAFIAATYAFTYAAEHNLYPKYNSFSYQQDTLMIQDRFVSLAQLAELTQTPLQTLVDLNPELQIQEIPYSKEAYSLRVPIRTAEYFDWNKKDILAQIDSSNKELEKIRELAMVERDKVSPASSGTAGKNLVYYKVRSGDVVGKIADRYGVRASDIARWNNLHNYRIKPGQKLKIYTKGKPSSTSSSTASTTKKPVPPPSKNARYHTVVSGDTLWDIARKYDRSVEDIQALNGMNGSSLKIGQKLRIR